VTIRPRWEDDPAPAGGGVDGCSARGRAHRGPKPRPGRGSQFRITVPTEGIGGGGGGPLAVTVAGGKGGEKPEQMEAEGLGGPGKRIRSRRGRPPKHKGLAVKAIEGGGRGVGEFAHAKNRTLRLRSQDSGILQGDRGASQHRRGKPCAWGKGPRPGAGAEAGGWVGRTWATVGAFGGEFTPAQCVCGDRSGALQRLHQHPAKSGKNSKSTEDFMGVHSEARELKSTGG